MTTPIQTELNCTSLLTGIYDAHLKSISSKPANITESESRSSINFKGHNAISHSIQAQGNVQFSIAPFFFFISLAVPFHFFGCCFCSYSCCRCSSLFHLTSLKVKLNDFLTITKIKKEQTKKESELINIYDGITINDINGGFLDHIYKFCFYCKYFFVFA